MAVKVLVRNADRAPAARRGPLPAPRRDGVPVAVLEPARGAGRGATAAPVTVAAKLPQPRLWSPADPYLYRVRAGCWPMAAVADAVRAAGRACGTSASRADASS